MNFICNTTFPLFLCSWRWVINLNEKKYSVWLIKFKLFSKGVKYTLLWNFCCQALAWIIVIGIHLSAWRHYRIRTNEWFYSQWFLMILKNYFLNFKSQNFAKEQRIEFLVQICSILNYVWTELIAKFQMAFFLYSFHKLPICWFAFMDLWNFELFLGELLWSNDSRGDYGIHWITTRTIQQKLIYVQSSTAIFCSTFCRNI